MTLTLYDSVTVAHLPVGGDAYGAYADGDYDNIAAAHARFPHAPVLAIAVHAADDADCLDIETGDATPAQAPGWVKRQQAKGVYRPVVYASQSRMPQVIAGLTAAGISRSEYRVWSAHYTQEHICSPTACKASFTADGTQWAGSPGNSPGPYDISVLADGFFAVSPAPTPPAPQLTEDDVSYVVSCNDGKTHPEFLVAGGVVIGLHTEADAALFLAKGAVATSVSIGTYTEVQKINAKQIA